MRFKFALNYIELEGIYLVPAGSPLRRIEDVDTDGVRVGVTARSAYDLFLTRELKHAGGIFGVAFGLTRCKKGDGRGEVPAVSRNGRAEHR